MSTDKKRGGNFMGLLRAFQDVVETVNDIKQSNLEAKTAELINVKLAALGDDTENPEVRKEAGEIIIALFNTQNFSKATEYAEQLATIFGKEFTYFYLPVAQHLHELKKCTVNVIAFENHKQKKLSNSLISANKRMEGITVDASNIESVVESISNFIKDREDYLNKIIEKDRGTSDIKHVLKGDTSADRVGELISYLHFESSSIFVYKCVAETLSSYKKLTFRKNPEIKNSEYAIPGPSRTPLDIRFIFMQQMSNLDDAEALFSLFNLINEYGQEKKNTVSVNAGVFGGACSVKINLNNGIAFLAKTCKIKLIFSGKKNRQLIVSGKLNLKKYPELLERAKSFSYWKIAEGKPNIQLDFQLKKEEFIQNINKIPDILKAINSENSEIINALSKK